MGLRNTLVDIWLGAVERLYVTDVPKEVQVVRPRRAVVVRPAQPEWEDVLFRGDPGTETGEHYDGEGTFKILANPRVAPPKHNRRSSDRAGADGQFNRRASDRRDGPFERRASDRADGPFERRGSDRGGDRAQDPDPARHS